MAKPSIPITGLPEADELLVTDPLALLIGMLLDQQVPMEWAFKGPWSLKDRLGGELDAGAIAAMGEDAVVEVFCAKPALHRYPARRWAAAPTSCASSSSTTTTATPARSGGACARATSSTAACASSRATARRRPRSSWPSWPSGSASSPAGWEAAAAPFSDDVPRSVADVGSPEPC